MQKRKFGNTNLFITPLGFGTLTMSPLQRGLSINEGANLLCDAANAGINFFDTAQMYGSYPQLSQALKQLSKPIRDQIIISSKSAAASYKDMTDAIDQALQEIGVEKIDCFLLHAVKSREDYINRSQALKALSDAQKNGKISYIGASTHYVEVLKFLIKEKEIQVLHPIINKFGVGVLDSSLDDLITILQEASNKGIAIYAMKPLGGGHLRARAQEALKWATTQDFIHSACVGMTTKDELIMNLKIVNNEIISDELKTKVQTKEKKLFVNQGLCIGCKKCEESCDQKAIAVENGKAKVDINRCVICGYCAKTCPVFALRVI